MKTPGNNKTEWFQVTVTLGNFESRTEAMDAIRSLKKREDFVTSRIEGSFDPARGI